MHLLIQLTLTISEIEQFSTELFITWFLFLYIVYSCPLSLLFITILYVFYIFLLIFIFKFLYLEFRNNNTCHLSVQQ